jgi:hypothetical protein
MYCSNLSFKFYPQTQKKACGILALPSQLSMLSLSGRPNAFLKSHVLGIKCQKVNFIVAS